MAALAFLYGLVSYAVFLCTFLYAIGFVGNLWVPKSVDIGLPANAAGEPLALSLLVDVLLLGLFAIQHSVMARPGFKRWWTRLVPKVVERSTYVLLASLSLVLLFAQWRPLPAPVWQVPEGLATWVVLAVQGGGWLLVLGSTFLIDHFELFGVKQVLARLTGRPLPPPVFRTPTIYRHVRHPIYLGFMLAFWAAPTMTAGHLLFAVATSGYILIGIWFEERDLVELFGQHYADYRQRVGMLLPLKRRYEDPLHAATAPRHDAAKQGTLPAPHRPAKAREDRALRCSRVRPGDVGWTTARYPSLRSTASRERSAVVARSERCRAGSHQIDRARKPLPARTKLPPPR